MKNTLIKIYYYYSILLNNLKFNIFTLVYKKDIIKLRDEDSNAIINFENETKNFFPYLLLPKTTLPKDDLDKNHDLLNTESIRPITSVKKDTQEMVKNPYNSIFKYYRKSNLTFIKSNKIRKIHAYIIEIVFDKYFGVKLSSRDSYILSCYNRVSHVCIHFLKFAGLRNVDYFRQEHIDIMKLFINSFVKRVEIKTNPNQYKLQKPKKPDYFNDFIIDIKIYLHYYYEIVRYYIKRFVFLVNGFSLGELLWMKYFSSERFLTTNKCLKGYHLQRTKFRLKNINYEFQKNMIGLKSRRNAAALIAHFQMIDRLIEKYELIMKRIKRKHIFSEDIESFFKIINTLFEKHHEIILSNYNKFIES